MAVAKVTGRVNVFINGKMLLNKAGAKATGIGISGQPNVERKGIMTDAGPAGYIENVVPARCEVTIVDRTDQSLSELVEIFGDGTIIFQTSGGTGKVYTMKNATCLGNLSLTAGEGDTTVVFEGPCWQEGVQ